MKNFIQSVAIALVFLFVVGGLAALVVRSATPLVQENVTDAAQR